MTFSSVIIFIINLQYFAVLDLKCQPPVAGDVQASDSLVVPGQLVGFPERESPNFSGSCISRKSVNIARSLSTASGGTPFALSSRYGFFKPFWTMVRIFSPFTVASCLTPVTFAERSRSWSLSGTAPVQPAPRERLAGRSLGPVEARRSRSFCNPRAAPRSCAMATATSSSSKRITISTTFISRCGMAATTAPSSISRCEERASISARSEKNCGHGSARMRQSCPPSLLCRSPQKTVLSVCARHPELHYTPARPEAGTISARRRTWRRIDWHRSSSGSPTIQKLFRCGVLGSKKHCKTGIGADFGPTQDKSLSDQRSSQKKSVFCLPRQLVHKS